MAVLLTYDVDQNAQIAVKEELLKIGFTDVFHGEFAYNLPNTTLCKDKLRYMSKDALEDIKRITAKMNVKLTKCFAVDFHRFSGYAGIEGEPHVKS